MSSDFSWWSFALGVIAAGGQFMIMNWLAYRRWRKRMLRAKLPFG